MRKLRKNLLVGSMTALLALGLTACPAEEEQPAEPGTDVEEPADTGTDGGGLES